MTTADKLRGLMEGATKGTINALVDGKPVPRKSFDQLLASVNLLPALAAVVEAMQEIAKEESGGYGFYLGGDPRKFHPDAESCTPKELAAHKEACDKWNEAEAKGEKMEPDPCGSGWISPSVHVTRSAYGLGSYTFPTDAARMAQAALAALRAVGGEGGKHG